MNTVKTEHSINKITYKHISLELIEIDGGDVNEVTNDENHPIYSVDFVADINHKLLLRGIYSWKGNDYLAIGKQTIKYMGKYWIGDFELPRYLDFSGEYLK